MLWEAEHTRHVQIHLGKTLALLHLLWTVDEQILKLTLILEQAFTMNIRAALSNMRL